MTKCYTSTNRPSKYVAAEELIVIDFRTVNYRTKFGSSVSRSFKLCNKIRSLRIRGPIFARGRGGGGRRTVRGY
jgi:hypothetical protein